MANQDWRTGPYAIDPQGRGNFDGQQEGLKGEEFTIVRYFDTSEVGFASGDDYKVFKIDAGVLIKSAHVVVVGTQATVTMGVGDSSSATAFHSALAVASNGAVALTTQEKYYTAADYLLITPSAAFTTAKFYVVLTGVRLA